MKKMFLSIFLVMVLIVMFSTVAFGKADPSSKAGEINIGDFTKTNVTGMEDLGGTIVGILRVGATVVAISLLLFVGIKFMLAAPSEKAQLKGALIPYLVGAILVFAAVPILGIIQNVGEQISTTTEETK